MIIHFEVRLLVYGDNYSYLINDANSLLTNLLFGSACTSIILGRNIKCGILRS